MNKESREKDIAATGPILGVSKHKYIANGDHIAPNYTLTNSSV